MKYFVTFGNNLYYNSLNRLGNQVKNLNTFDGIYVVTDAELKKNEEFQNKHKYFIENNRRGYGYWIWKSYIVSKKLEEMKEDDILVYADAGCTFNEKGMSRLNEYFDIVNKSKFGILSFQMDLFEKTWTKMDLFLDLDCLDLKETGQLVGGIFIIRKCSHSINLVNMWHEKCCNYHLLDDSPSLEKNDSSFREHRHDQSIFSLIRKKYGTEILEDETYTFPNWNLKYPIWATRLK
jgi:hypothetical protein